MRRHHHSFSTILLTTALCLGGTTFLPEAMAWAGVPFNPPSGGAPKGRGGASRGNMSCAANPIEFIRHFTPLAPVNSNYGLTVSQRPTMFAYIPPSSAQKVFFSLKDGNGQVHYQAILPLVNKGGVVRFDLPNSAPPLVVGQRYQWGVAVLCTAKLRPDSPFVSSWIQRVDPAANLVGQSGQVASLERATAYGTHGIWYDTMATLGDLRQQQPNNSKVLSAWSGLLSAVGLGEIASEPLSSQLAQAE